MHSLKREPIKSEINGAHFVPPSKTTQLNLWQKLEEERSATFESSSLLKNWCFVLEKPGRNHANQIERIINRA